MKKKNESLPMHKKKKKEHGESIDEPADLDESGFQSTMGESIYEDFDHNQFFLICILVLFLCIYFKFQEIFTITYFK